MASTKPKPIIDHELSLKSGSHLRGMQSVRVSFRLNAGCIQAVSIVSAHLGIKQKSLFDHLMQDAQALHAIARELKNTRLDTRHRQTKTFVISRQSLDTLETAARAHQAPRDALVEFSIQRLLPIIIKEQARYDQRQAMFAKVLANFNQGKQVLDEIEGSLGTEDPAFKKLSPVMSAYANAVKAMEGFLEKAKAIEDFCPDKLMSP